MKRYSGGCAVMLKVPAHAALEPVKSTVDQLAKGWRVHGIEDYHLTLQFVGRDLLSDKIMSVVAASFVFADKVGEIPLRMTGAMSTFRTTKGQYLVMQVDPDEALLAARKSFRSILQEMGVSPKDGFDFKPHVTLAETTPSAPALELPAPMAPIPLRCNELIVKYGHRRMAVDL